MYYTIYYMEDGGMMAYRTERIAPDVMLYIYDEFIRTKDVRGVMEGNWVIN